MDIEHIIKEIKSVDINLATMHQSEHKRITRIFYEEIMKNGWYGADEVQQALNELDYPDRIKDQILSIALVIQDIKDQP